MSNWNIIEYTVIGNADNGFKVAEEWDSGHVIAIDDFEEDEGVWQALFDAGWLPDASGPKDIDVEGDEDELFVKEAADGYPILELHRTHEEIPGEI